MGGRAPRQHVCSIHFHIRFVLSHPPHPPPIYGRLPPPPPLYSGTPLAGGRRASVNVARASGGGIYGHALAAWDGCVAAERRHSLAFLPGLAAAHVARPCPGLLWAAFAATRWLRGTAALRLSGPLVGLDSWSECHRVCRSRGPGSGRLRAGLGQGFVQGNFFFLVPCPPLTDAASLGRHAEGPAPRD